MQRREFLKGSTLGLAALGAGAAVHDTGLGADGERRAGALKQSVCKWCYPKQSVEELAVAAKRIGLRSVELLDPPDWPAVQKHGLTVALCNAPGPGGIPKGFNRLENHEWLVPAYLQRIQEAKDAGVPNVILFSGNREGMDDEEGRRNCAVGLAKIVPAAEKAGVMLVMELLNSKVNHPDYMCDHTSWGVALVKEMGSEHFKLLYDIYHMQIMEGDVIRTIRDNHEYIAHYHTGGVPGRHEIDETQELYYPAVMRAIEETGYQGFVAQEFVPTGDPLASLAAAYRICNV